MNWMNWMNGWRALSLISLFSLLHNLLNIMNFSPPNITLELIKCQKRSLKSQRGMMIKSRTESPPETVPGFLFR